jgi:hypothetical protein
LILHLFVISMLLQACALPGLGAKTDPTESPVVAPATQPVVVAATEPAAVPVNEPAAATEPVAAIVHTVLPVTGTKQVSTAHDNEEIATFAEKGVRGGDNFRSNRFERPFTAGDMNYLPYIDIVDIGMTSDDNFYYIQIKLAGVDEAINGVSGYYGVEFDLDKDGKTEFLVLAQAPAGKDWTTDGVQVFVDDNADIGGLSSKPDDVYAGDGYEKTVFDSGAGDDPDLAWTRFINNSTPVVEIAFKKAALKDAPNFMFSVLASESKPDPTKMYFNDTLSEQRAGSPIKGNKYYPLNELAAYDNTCRLPAGFQPTGSEPYGCSIGGPENEKGPIEFKPGKSGLIFLCISCLFPEQPIIK